MAIAFTDAFASLANALPNFQASDEDWNEHASYFFLMDMRLFVCDRALSGGALEIKQFGALLEHLVSEGDSDVQDLVLDTLEGLEEHSAKSAIAKGFGPKTMHLWSSLPR